MNLKDRFVLFTDGKTQEKHKVISVQKIPEVGNPARISAFILHTTRKEDHKIIKVQTVLSFKHMTSLSDRGRTTMQKVKLGESNGSSLIELID